MRKGVLKIIVCFILAAAPAAVALTSAINGAAKNFDNIGGIGNFAIKAEELAHSGIPFGEELKSLGRAISMFGGTREINGVFVSQNGLMKNIAPPDPALVDKNIQGVASFAEWARAYGKPVYVMLIPTSAAITRQNLPQFGEEATVNQRELIEDVYNRVSNSASYIDAYTSLLDQRGRYIYYRTEGNLTSLGGYYIYSAILSRLGIGAASLDEFDIEYSDTSFYGDLYTQSEYSGVMPDTVSIFRHSKSNRRQHEYLVLQKAETDKLYHTLFPRGASLLGDELSVFLGGLSSVTDIHASPPNSSKILLFGDKTAISYLPLLANNVSRVTYVDLSGYQAEAKDIVLDGYDQIIFAYGVETFIQTDTPSRAELLVEE